MGSLAHGRSVGNTRSSLKNAQGRTFCFLMMQSADLHRDLDFMTFDKGRSATSHRFFPATGQPWPAPSPLDSHRAVTLTTHQGQCALGRAHDAPTSVLGVLIRRQSRQRIAAKLRHPGDMTSAQPHRRYLPSLYPLRLIQIRGRFGGN